MVKARDYGKEYREYHGKPEQIRNRADRNQARSKMIKKVGAAAVAGKDVHHKRGIAAGNGHDNLGILSIKKNRGLK
jgi:hypothetical protein